MTTTEEKVDLFVNILTKAAHQRGKVISKSLLGHTKHCLGTLARKQTSFQTALQVLGRRVWPACVQILSNDSSQQQQRRTTLSSHRSSSGGRDLPLTIEKDDIPKVLEHVFTQLLRLHDGLILLVSGECRHQGDIRAKKPYPTRLTQNSTRSDGYTQLYKSTLVYSGASNDEWFDERNGLQKAWQDVLGAKFWERLLEKHALLEALLTELETNMQQLQLEFSHVSKRILHDLKALFPHVEMSMADHMERLVVDPWSWERRGKSFQWKHVLGILPEGWKACQWYESLSWQPPRRLVHTNNRGGAPKRRRVIDDDDDDEDDTVRIPKTTTLPKQSTSTTKESNSQTLAEGLKVTTKTIPTSAPPVDDSLNTIKTQLGVNVQALQNAREGLEAEELAARDVAHAEDQAAACVAGDDDSGDSTEQQKRKAATQRVGALSKHLRRMIHRSSGLHDVWDARECLRQVLMEAGNLYLWSDSKTNSEDRRRLLRVADEYFEQASQMVKAQKLLHDHMVIEQGSTEELKLCWRNLLLLQSQALVNRGITQIEMGQPESLSKAIQYLEECEKECRLLQKQAHADKAKGVGAFETTLDGYAAKETETLARRWRAEALWKKGSKANAVSIFGQAGSAYEAIDNKETLKNINWEIIRASLSACTESYYAWVQLVDLLAMDLHKADRTAPWEWIKSQLKVAFAGAVKCSQTLGRDVLKAGGRLQSFLIERDVMNEEALKKSKLLLIENLERRRHAFSRSMRDDEAPPQLYRSDISNSDFLSAEVPSRWLLAGDSDSRQSQKRKRYGSGYSNIRVSNDSEEVAAYVPPKQKFRRWGDDLFPLKKDENGNLVRDLPYPFCAPKMPESIRLLLEQK